MGLIVAAPLSGLPFADDLDFTSRIEGGPECTCMEHFDLPVNVGRCPGPLCWCQSTAGVHRSGGFWWPSPQTLQ
jgi:hypothetical protein